MTILDKTDQTTVNRFNVTAERAELAALDRTAGSIARNIAGPYATVALRALAEVERLTGAVDIDGAALAGINVPYPDLTAADCSPKMLAEARSVARAVLAHVGREVASVSPRYVPTEAEARSVMVGACVAAGFTERQTIERLAAHAASLEEDLRRKLEMWAPRMSVTLPASRPITEADVEEAAREAYAVEHIPMTWGDLSPYKERARLAEARAILNWTASRNLAPAATVDTGRADRLGHCRDRAAKYVAARGVPESWDATDLAQEIESLAHAMLAAERSPT